MKYIVYLIDRILLTRQRLLKKIFYFCLVLIFFVLNYKHIFRRCYNNHDFEMKLCIVNHYVSIPLASEPGEGDKGSLSAPPPLRFCKVKHNLNYFLLAKVFDGPSTPPTLLSICFRRYWILLTVSIQTIDKLVTTLQGTLYMECQKVQYFIIV